MIFKLFLSPGTEITVLSGHLHPIKACTLLKKKKNYNLNFPSASICSDSHIQWPLLDGDWHLFMEGRPEAPVQWWSERPWGQAVGVRGEQLWPQEILPKHSNNFCGPGSAYAGVVVSSVLSWVGLILSRLMSRGKLPSLVQSGLR